jgi:hypothetical protein
MNLTPIELYLTLVVIIPLGVCFMKWRYSVRWTVATAICAATSWVYFNLWMAVFDPPDNGFANLVCFISGWFWLLPIFGFFALLAWFVERRITASIQLRLGITGFSVCSVLALLIVCWNIFGNMSEARAITEARRELRRHGYEPNGREVAECNDDYWIVRYPDADYREIRLTRNGKMSWIGGPG